VKPTLPSTTPLIDIGGEANIGRKTRNYIYHLETADFQSAAKRIPPNSSIIFAGPVRTYFGSIHIIIRDVMFWKEDR